jgi:hypothetical protein
MMTPSIVRSLLPASKSNPQDSQNRPDLPAPQCGQVSAGSAGCGSAGCGSAGCGSAGSWGGTGGASAGALAGAPILIPQTSQKSLLADV